MFKDFPGLSTGYSLWIHLWCLFHCSIFQGLVQKARKAKNRLLKREGDDRAESGAQGYESFSYGGVDPYMWEPQELGKKLSSFIHQMLIEHLCV